MDSFLDAYYRTIYHATNLAYNGIPDHIRVRVSHAHLKGQYENVWPSGRLEVKRFQLWDEFRAEIERVLREEQPPNLKLAKRHRVELPNRRRDLQNGIVSEGEPVLHRLPKRRSSEDRSLGGAVRKPIDGRE